MGAKVKRINSKEELSQGLQEILNQWFDPSKWKGMSKGERPTPGRTGAHLLVLKFCLMHSMPEHCYHCRWAQSVQPA